jgi:hypothetical protein
LAGVAEHQVLRIEEAEDPKRAAIFAFARKVSREPASITREDVDSLRPYLKEAQIVELVFAVCRYNTMNRLADAFGVPLEKENVFAPPPAKEGTPTPVPEPPTERTTSVIAVREDRVVIAAGTDNGIGVGDYFNLDRGSAYVGRIKIMAVDSALAIGMFDVDNPGSMAPAQPGDRAVSSTGFPRGRTSRW